jgi:hypothetical protein
MFYEWVYGKFQCGIHCNVMAFINAQSVYRGAGMVENVTSAQFRSFVRGFDSMYRTNEHFSHFTRDLMKSIFTYVEDKFPGRTGNGERLDAIKTLLHNLKSYDDNILFRKVIGLLNFNKKVFLISNDKYEHETGIYKLMDKKVGFGDSISYLQTHPTLGMTIDTGYQFYPSYDEKLDYINGAINPNNSTLNHNWFLWRHNVFNVAPREKSLITDYINNYLLAGPNFKHHGHRQNHSMNDMSFRRHIFPLGTIRIPARRFPMPSPAYIAPIAMPLPAHLSPPPNPPPNPLSGRLIAYLTRLRSNSATQPLLAFLINDEQKIRLEELRKTVCASFDFNFTDYMSVDMDVDGSQQKKYLKYQNKYLKYKQKYLELKKKLSM